MKFSVNEKNEITYQEIPIDKQKISTKILKYNDSKEMVLYSIIKRHAIRRSRDRPVGDNCPMLYAMKKTDSLVVHDEIVEKLYAYTEKLIRSHSFPDKFDLIIIMPSKHNIAICLADILKKVLDIPIKADFLQKNSVDNVIKEINENKSISHSDKQSLLSALKKCNGVLSVKNVKLSLRKYIPIFKGRRVSISPSIKHILLVDDISSSGSTFEYAAKLIQKHCSTVEKISAFTLFSPLK